MDACGGGSGSIFHSAQVACLLLFPSTLAGFGLISEKVFLVSFIGPQCKKGFSFIN